MGIHDELDAHGASNNSSALSVQHSEMKMEMLHSLWNSQTQLSLKPLEGILDDKRATIVTRSLASSRTLSKSFDMYLQNVSDIIQVCPLCSCYVSINASWIAVFKWDLLLLTVFDIHVCVDMKFYIIFSCWLTYSNCTQYLFLILSYVTKIDPHLAC